MPAVGDEALKDKPLYWLVILDQAMEQGDLQLAADAQGELARLGVRIAYGRPKATREEALDVR
jgi:hypothetical protein